jgi:hypothetical protein
VQALPSRICLDRPIRIVTGSDASRLASAGPGGSPELRHGLEADVELLHTALAHPEAWRAAPELFPADATDPLTGSCADCLHPLFPGEHLDDGALIIGYDAVRTAVSAVRAGDRTADTPDLVAGQLGRLHGELAVPGASGWLSFTPSGEPEGRALPVVRIRPDGGAELVGLAAPGG